MQVKINFLQGAENGVLLALSLFGWVICRSNNLTLLPTSLSSSATQCETGPTTRLWFSFMRPFPTGRNERVHPLTIVIWGQRGKGTAACPQGFIDTGSNGSARLRSGKARPTCVDLPAATPPGDKSVKKNVKTPPASATLHFGLSGGRKQ